MRKLDRALCLSGKGHGIFASRSICSPTWRWSIRSISSSSRGAEKFPFTYPDELHDELAPYLVTEPATPRFADYLKGIAHKHENTVNFLVALNQQIARDVRYLIRMEPGVQTPEETLTSAAGSCRDSAWLLVQILRHLGLAARFVSGYLIQLKPDIKAIDGPAGTDVDFTDLHAWAEVYLPGAGWIGLDATSGLVVRRKPSAARSDASLSLRRADRGRRREGRGHIRLRDEGDAHRGKAAHHLSVLRRRLEGARCARRQGRCRSCGEGRAPHHGRRADLRVDRRLSGGGMEHCRCRADQAHARPIN